MKNKNMVQKKNKRQTLSDTSVRLVVEKEDLRPASTCAIVSMDNKHCCIDLYTNEFQMFRTILRGVASQSLILDRTFLTRLRSLEIPRLSFKQQDRADAGV